MLARIASIGGTASAAFVAIVLAIAPMEWLVELLQVRPENAASFLVHRYAVSATLALAVCAAAIARHTDSVRSVLLGFATWFAVQGAVAIVGLASGIVGGLALLAAFADPLIAAILLVFALRTGGADRSS